MSFTTIAPFAVNQGHGTPIVPIAAEDGNGEYTITDINYIHRGFWTLTFEMTSSAGNDTVVFTFCILDAV